MLEIALRRDRAIVIAALMVVVGLAAVYTVMGIGMSMSALTMTRMALEMPGMAMRTAAWSPAYALLVFLMWWVMMVAMMVPSAAPAILLYAGLQRKRKAVNAPYTAAVFFLAGYLLIWAGFSLVATTLQWGLETLGVMTGMMEITSKPLAGAVLIGAGLYQLTGLKQACLRHCQHPLSFLLHNWKPGLSGAMRMGARHGGYCLGCCWVLMALLFVGGIMNLIWIAGIAIYVGVEKVAAGHRWVTTFMGVVLTALGAWLGFGPYLMT